MKKLLALLLTALLLIPALAMAETFDVQKIPTALTPDTIKTSNNIRLTGTANQGSLGWELEGTSFKANYSLGGTALNDAGTLISYDIQYEPTLALRYNCYGEIIGVRRGERGPFIPTSQIKDGNYDKYKLDGPVTDTSSSILKMNNVTDTIYGVKSFIDLKKACTSKADGGYWPVNNQSMPTEATLLMKRTVNIEDDTGKLTTQNLELYYVTNSDFESLVFALYCNDEFYESYVKTAYFTPRYDVCYLTNDVRYGINTYGHFDYSTGDLYEYQLYTADRSINSVYNTKNVLVSTETWDSDGGWWGLWEGEESWLYSANGNPDDAIKRSPTDEVLENVLKAPGSATYSSACVTDSSQLDTSLKGVPFIVSDSSMTGITPSITATQNDKEGKERETEFDITLYNGTQKTSLSKPVTLTLGFPAGITYDVSKNYDFLVVHDDEHGNLEYMSSAAGNLNVTENGPTVEATSFSPYTVIWGDKQYLEDYRKDNFKDAKLAVSVSPSSLPQTGDTSNLVLYAVLLAACAGGLCVLLAVRKRRANR